MRYPAFQILHKVVGLEFQLLEKPFFLFLGRSSPAHLYKLRLLLQLNTLGTCKFDRLVYFKTVLGELLRHTVVIAGKRFLLDSAGFRRGELLVFLAIWAEVGKGLPLGKELGVDEAFVLRDLG